MNNLTSAAWWKAAGIRALRTAILVAVTYVPATLTDAVPYVVLGSAAAVAAILSLIMSLAGIAEVDGTTQPWYFAILSRVVKTVAQALAGGVLANAVFLSDISWEAVLATTLAAGFGSLLLGVLKTLPESDVPVANATVPITVTNVYGVPSEQAVPAVAQATVSGEINPETGVADRTQQ
jgi:hypothetical protein